MSAVEPLTPFARAFPPGYPPVRPGVSQVTIVVRRDTLSRGRLRPIMRALLRSPIVWCLLGCASPVSRGRARAGHAVGLGIHRIKECREHPRPVRSCVRLDQAGARYGCGRASPRVRRGPSGVQNDYFSRSSRSRSVRAAAWTRSACAARQRSRTVTVRARGPRAGLPPRSGCCATISLFVLRLLTLAGVIRSLSWDSCCGTGSVAIQGPDAIPRRQPGESDDGLPEMRQCVRVGDREGDAALRGVLEEGGECAA